MDQCRWNHFKPSPQGQLYWWSCHHLTEPELLNFFFFFSATHCCHCWKNTTITITESVPRDLWPLKHFIWVMKETEKAPYYRKWHWTLPMQMVGFLSMQERGETTHKLKKYFPNWCSMHYSILLFCDNVTMEFAGQVQIVNMATMPVFESCFTL